MNTVILPVYNSEGKEVEKLELDAHVFDGTINNDALHQAVVAFGASQRRGFAATKTRGEVSGGGKKPWKQKGTGRSRHGSSRSPLWRHGGVVFGPHPRDYSYALPVKIKSLALKSSLNAKVKEDNLLVLDKVSLESKKTKDVVKIFSNLKINEKSKKLARALLLVGRIDDNLRLASRNVSFLAVGRAQDACAYEVLASKKLLITKDGLQELVKRLKK